MADREPVTQRQRLFGDHVRQRRHDAGLSQEALAHRAGVNRSYYASLEAGRRNPSLETICRLAVALGCDAADLVRGTQARRGRSR
jgi:XRE family transcriptional regulator, regulator of sulfur utilization